MTPTQSLRVLRHQLHLSYSQINTYLTCSLRYFFQYVKGYGPEHTSSALALGSSIHASLARYYVICQHFSGQEFTQLPSFPQRPAEPHIR